MRKVAEELFRLSAELDDLDDELHRLNSILFRLTVVLESVPREKVATLLEHYDLYELRSALRHYRALLDQAIKQLDELLGGGRG